MGPKETAHRMGRGNAGGETGLGGDIISVTAWAPHHLRPPAAQSRPSRTGPAAETPVRGAPVTPAAAGARRGRSPSRQKSRRRRPVRRQPDRPSRRRMRRGRAGAGATCAWATPALLPPQIPPRPSRRRRRRFFWVDMAAALQRGLPACGDTNGVAGGVWLQHAPPRDCPTPRFCASRPGRATGRASRVAAGPVDGPRASPESKARAVDNAAAAARRLGVRTVRAGPARRPQSADQEDAVPPLLPRGRSACRLNRPGGSGPVASGPAQQPSGHPEAPGPGGFPGPWGPGASGPVAAADSRQEEETGETGPGPAAPREEVVVALDSVGGGLAPIRLSGPVPVLPCYD
jgi:hypothetical protein